MNVSHRFLVAVNVIVLAMAASGCKKQETPATPATSQPSTRGEVRVAAAADLQFALGEIIATFEKDHPNVHVTVTYGASGNFFSQLSNKAPFDVFLSADASYPQKLVEQGLAGSSPVFKYAVGHIVLWAPKDSAFDVKQGLAALSSPKIKRIAIANPQHAPYGRAAVAALEKSGVYDQIKDRLILGENIAQTAQFISSGSADTGIIALSLALAPQMKDKGSYWEIPTDSYPPIEQAGVIMNWASDAGSAKEFRDYLLSEQGRATLARFGFSPPH